MVAWIMTCLYAVVLLHNVVPHFHFDPADAHQEEHHHHSQDAGAHHHPLPAAEDGLWVKAFHSLQHSFAHFDLGANHLNTYNKVRGKVNCFALAFLFYNDSRLPVPVITFRQLYPVRYSFFYFPPPHNPYDLLRGPPAEA